MIRTLSPASSNTSCSSSEQPPSTHTRRLSFHALARRLSDSKKSLLDNLPHHQQHITRFRNRAKSFLSSSLLDHLSDIHRSSSERRNSSTAVYKSSSSNLFKLYLQKYLNRTNFLYLDH